MISDFYLDTIAIKVKTIPVNKRLSATIFKNAVYKNPSLIFNILKIYSGI